MSCLLGVRLPPLASFGGKAGLFVNQPTASETRKTLQRDDHTCQICGFRATRYQRVISCALITAAAGNSDADWEDNGRSSQKPSQFVTLCQFCELCVALDRVGIAGTGVLIWLPEISQPDLNNVVRALYIAQASGDSTLAPLATKTLQALTARSEAAQKRLGTDDPSVLATVLIENIDPQSRDQVRPKLEGIRLLPHDRWYIRTARGDADIFKRLIAFWRSPEGSFADIPVASWTKTFAGIVGSGLGR